MLIFILLAVYQLYLSQRLQIQHDHLTHSLTDLTNTEVEPFDRGDELGSDEQPEVERQQEHLREHQQWCGREQPIRVVITDRDSLTVDHEATRRLRAA